MKKLFILGSLLLSSHVFAESKLSVDLTVDDLHFQRPAKGIGKAGNLIFKTANVNNSGIILNINNVNNYFNSQIFLRPTFMGFTTQFGNYGFTLEPDNIFNTINTIELVNSKFILDDNQLNLAGEHLKYVDPENDIKLNNFRLYCQSPAAENPDAPPASTDMMQNCLNYLTLNGNYKAANEIAALEYKTANKLTGDKTALTSKVRSVDIRKDKIQLQLSTIQSVSNDTYTISGSEINLNCAKDPTLKEFNTDKIIKDCINTLKIAPLKANIVDSVEKTKFTLDIKDVTVKEKILYFTLNSGALSDATSTTFINNLLLNCRKETDTDVLELPLLLKDCLTYARISIGEVKSTKPDDPKGSSITKIAISSASGALIINADVKLLGFTSRVYIYGTATVDAQKKQLLVNVTDTRLPLGLSSVKILMFFLKKNLISKDIKYVNNNITISL